MSEKILKFNKLREHSDPKETLELLILMPVAFRTPVLQEDS